MTLRFATDEEIQHWDDLLVDNPDDGNIFQSREIAEHKRATGWRPRYLRDDDMAITVHERSVFGLGKLWYLPKGPGVAELGRLESLIDALRAFGKQYGVFAVKIEPELQRDIDIHQRLTELGLVKTRAIQPNSSTVVLDLSPSLDEIMTGLNQKGRHAIRRAERDGVTAVPVDFTDENTRIMYDLLAQTAEGKWQMRSYEYYKTFWQAFADQGTGQLFFAYYDGQVVASAFSMYLGSKGTYKDGASVRERTAYGASHLLQWEIIKWMKDRGVTSYDLCGTPASDQIRDETHHHYGLGRFKTSFNKHVTDYIGAYDIPVRPFSHKVWLTIGERLTLRLSVWLKQRQWY